MDKPDETTENREPETPWGTWEELLLACAVHRHGANRWDSVAIEIQKRSSTASLGHLLTPYHCERKYHDLKRRYTPQNDAASPAEACDANSVPWLDELRKLRVAELRREVERYDLSIVSLQLKVKRLKEEREQSLKEDENGGEKSDLEKSVEREREGEENRGEEEMEPESVAGKPVTGEDSDGDNQSVNESNSTDPKSEVQKTRVEEPEPVRTGEPKSTKPVGEDSWNGSSDSIEKRDPVRESLKAEPEGGVSDSPELWESVAESKGGGGEDVAAKESSDVQSSASKSRKELGSDKVRSVSISGDEPENEDQSAAVKRTSVKLHSLIDFLEIVWSHKLGSVFERRLESQETPEYRNLIRQHIDFETIRTRLNDGWYSSCNRKLYRDLLLLVNNAILFFGKESRESNAANELQQLISKEIPQTNLKLDSSAEEGTSTPSLPLSSKPEPEPEPEPEPSDSLLLKPKISGPIIVCRKRSSIAAKASGSSSGPADRKREKKAALLEDKPILDWKQSNKPSDSAEENLITKKRTRDRFTSGSRSSTKNGKNRTNTTPNKNSETPSNQNQGKRASSSEHSEPKSEKNTNSPVSGAKKRGAANFLNRMKRGLSTDNGPLLDTLKSSTPNSSNSNKGGAEQQKNKNGKGKSEVKKEQPSRRGSGARQAKEPVSPAKRNVGRPPKRAAAPSPSTPAPATNKRSREGGYTEAVASRQPKNRSRK
ncbi:Bromodomain-containing protein [Actinidia chinensis var. chinensis]|uniref:Bromodomain-containing protein n=1 Tax=Actinidia chinensis var. chinensis TaxID=1590841 RepID=A0A2R6P2P4_ACTCC|nr:Bromodomain-containing protein [Actinidia chinensis var. chinensis]